MDNIPILKRPKPTDSEDELFRMQEEFLRNQQEPSAKVINLRDSGKGQSHDNSNKRPEAQPGPAKVKSRFAELKRLRTEARVSTSQTGGDIINPALNKEEQKVVTKNTHDSVQNLPIAPSSIILGNIVEKKYTGHGHEFNLDEKDSSNSWGSGFPEVFQSSLTKNDCGHSLFWQQVSQEKRSTNKVDCSQNVNTSCIGENSIVVEGSWATEIHKDNLERLSQMTEQDILKEKKKLEMILKPDTIQFLKDRRNKIQKVNEDKQIILKSNVSNEEQNVTVQEGKNKIEEGDLKKESKCLRIDDDVEQMEVDESKEALPKPPMELMVQAKEKGWVHMDSVEHEKLKWMEDLPVAKNDVPAPDEPYNARFDFNGILLPYKDESVPIEKGLHHHGEEPERPGYSLQELLQLSRSSAQQQRCTALKTLAYIIEKSRNGWYDKALSPPPLTALSQRNLLLLLRFSLDDTSMAVVTASLQALRAFLYSEVDELCLDRLFGFNNYKEPTLMPPKNDVTDTSTLKDHELVQLDAVSALLRTDILLRIRYILTELRPPPVGVTCALEILIRLIRHSNITALNVASTPNLLDAVIKHFMPLSVGPLVMEGLVNDVYGVPLAAAVKFCRVLLCYGGRPVAQRLDRLNVVQSVMSYVSCDTGKGTLNLSIESLRLWKTLLLHDVTIDSLNGAQLTLLSQLQLLLCNHDLENSSELSAEYAAALISVASCLTPLKENISVLLSKWSTQLLSLSNPTWGNTKLLAETLLATDDAAVIKKLFLSRSQTLSRLGSTSNLLCGYTSAIDREPSCLPNLGVLSQDGEMQPIVSVKSCIPFLAIVLNVFVNHSLTSEIQAVLDQPDVRRYLRRLEATDWSLERSWYTRFELSLLVSVVKAAYIVRHKLEVDITHVIWKIAIKLVSALPADFAFAVKDMIKIVLSEEISNLETIAAGLSKLNLNPSMDDIKMNFNCDVISLYTQYIALKGEWNQAAMPKDWLYLPLVHIYTKCKNSGTCDDKDKTSILTLLSLEVVLPDLVGMLSPSLRFSRLILVYLCDTLYLNNDVSALLSEAIVTILKGHHKKLNFTLDLPGLNSFTDLFTAMCEHFASTSYGDPGFSMTLLVPIAQRHDVHYRKLLWSEHAGVLRYLRLPLEQLAVPLKEYFYPIETDTSLIESYITSLVRGIVKQAWCPIPYAIALHHSAMYIKQSDKLAVRMRMQVEKLSNKGLATNLLHYEPPAM